MPVYTLDQGDIVTKEAPQIFGEGNGSVYMYYYPSYKALADMERFEFWPCKIGRTDGLPINRIASQTGTALPEYPVFAVHFKTYTPTQLESAIHSVLRLKFRECHSPGSEWFFTNADEVIKIAHDVGLIPPDVGQYSNDGGRSVFLARDVFKKRPVAVEDHSKGKSAKKRIRAYA